MSKDTSLSKAQLDLLKQFKKQVGADQAATQTQKTSKQPEKLSSAKQAQAEQQDDHQLFANAMQGVKKIDSNDLAPITSIAKTKKIDAQTLAKRIAAEGTTETDDTVLSDTQALLNPVASQAFLSYRIATLQNRVFEDLKAGKLRWFEAVDLHGCTMEQARTAVLQLIQLAKDDNQNVIKIVHGKGPEGILKTCVNGWLRQHRDVLAFVSAPENQGGTGAVLVLLKRAEKNPKYQEGK
ncbi:Smr/MutS family protein [Acinetobacter populi]|uniref:DNA mismatch repair protein MutS n=1 Tax=Acinetobacter populi TaxID=1582270 RepID=A0A1Z9YUP3_9GAMM|nr:Smr/MutS family protein [Acinetobacter populi]OUY05920.1 DNA mismatch repair protein MutS [Acinetobacter populi]